MVLMTENVFLESILLSHESDVQVTVVHDVANSITSMSKMYIP